MQYTEACYWLVPTGSSALYKKSYDSNKTVHDVKKLGGGGGGLLKMHCKRSAWICTLQCMTENLTIPTARALVQNLRQCFSTAGPWHQLYRPSSYSKKNLLGRGLTNVENHWLRILWKFIFERTNTELQAIWHFTSPDRSFPNSNTLTI
jgi:hypothetical protein